MAPISSLFYPLLPFIAYTVDQSYQKRGRGRRRLPRTSVQRCWGGGGGFESGSLEPEPTMLTNRPPAIDQVGVNTMRLSVRNEWSNGCLVVCVCDVCSLLAVKM